MLSVGRVAHATHASMRGSAGRGFVTRPPARPRCAAACIQLPADAAEQRELLALEAAAHRREGVDSLLASMASINDATPPNATTPLLATSMIPLQQRYCIRSHRGHSLRSHSLRPDLGVSSVATRCVHFCEASARVCVTVSVYKKKWDFCRVPLQKSTAETLLWSTGKLHIYLHVWTRLISILHGGRQTPIACLSTASHRR